MNLEIATVLSCTDTGCRVQPVSSSTPLETRFSKPVVKYNIPIHPNQFVIVDQDTSPPETIFRWSRAVVTKVDGDTIELDDNGRRLLATRGNIFEGDIGIGDDVVMNGYTDKNRRVIDQVIDNKPAHPEKLAANRFATMKDAEARAAA